MGTDKSSADPGPPHAESPTVRDVRTPPRGVLPRQIQTWLMVGIALVIVIIILITGRTEPATRLSSAVRSLEPALAPADRIRTYEQQLAQEEVRQREAGRGADNRTSTERMSVASSRSGAV